MRVLLGAIQVASWGQIHWTSQAGKKASDTRTLGELQFSLGITAPPSEPMASVTCCISSGKSGVYQTNHLVCMGQRSAAPKDCVPLCLYRSYFHCHSSPPESRGTENRLEPHTAATVWWHGILVPGTLPSFLSQNSNGKVGRVLMGEARDLTKRNLWLAQ